MMENRIMEKWSGSVELLPQIPIFQHSNSPARIIPIFHYSTAYLTAETSKGRALGVEGQSLVTRHSSLFHSSTPAAR